MGRRRSIRALSKKASGRFHTVVISGTSSNVKFVTHNNFMDTTPVGQWQRDRLMAIAVCDRLVAMVAREHLVVTTAYGGSGSSG